MLAEIGYFALLLSWIAAIYAIVALVYGERIKSDKLVLSGRNAALLNFGLLLVSTGALQIGLMTQAYDMAYVWSVTDPNMPEFYRMSSLWGSQAGSLLFWSFLMSAFAAAAVLLNWRTHRRLMPYATAYMMAVVVFFVALSLFFENPFERWWNVTGEEAAKQGYDVVLVDTGDDPVAVGEAITSMTGMQGINGTSLAAMLPMRLQNCVTPDGANSMQQMLGQSGGVVELIPAQQCVTRSTLAPPTGTLVSTDRLAESARGLNPLLRHFGMVIHPPMLYLGFVGFVVPFAFAMAALASGDLSTNWIKASRRWTLVAWLFLSLGLILGGRWAYDVLGWGGYWGWDPVENAAFLPWLIGTAFLHSVMIQEKRGMLKTWNMFLIIFTFSAVIFGTFATRSGLVESVHSFARSEIGFPMFWFWFTLTLISVVMILYRRNQGLLRDEHRFTSLFSRETLFVINNLIFVALFIAVFWGSFGAPIVSEMFLDTNITLGTDYFNRVTPPLFLALFILMGIAPLSAWGKTSLARMGRALAVPVALTLVSLGGFVLMGMSSIGALIGYGFVLLAGWVAIYEVYRGVSARRKVHKESILHSLRALFARNPRRYGGYLIHLGVVVIGIGVIGSTVYQVETQQTLAVGESLSIGGYELRYDRLDRGQIADDGRMMDIANVTVIRDGRELAQLRPRRDFFPNNAEMNSMTIAGAHSTLENDFYVLLVGWEPVEAGAATFKVYINPLVNLVWWGGLVLIVGTVFSVWPREVLPARVRHKLRYDAPVAPAMRGV